MAKRDLSSMVKIVSLVLLLLVLCFGPGCKKSAEEPGTAADPNTPATVEPAVETPAVEPAAVEPAATEPVAAEPVAEAAPAVEMAPLEIVLPKPMFVGTPQDTRVENLRKPLGKARPPMLAPAGTQLLSLNKPVSASDEEPIIGEIEMITDGDKEAADGSYVELGPGLQHATVDLEAECEIHAICVWHYHKQARVYFDVVAQISNDPDFITGVTTVFNNDLDNTAGVGIGTDMHYTETNEGELIDCLSKGSPKGRYVRLYSNKNTSNDLNHYIEIDVYGKPVK
jgi:hypothetical protein